MTIGVVNCFDGIADRQVLCGCLTVRPIIGAGNYIEVTHLMDERASLGVCASCRRSPEYIAQLDGVGLIGIDIGIIFLFASAVEGDRRGIHRVANGGEVTVHGIVAT